MPIALSEHPIVLTLDRQQARRLESLPTLTALCGPVGLGMRRWRAWASGRELETFKTSGTGIADIASVWWLGLASSRDLFSIALDWLGRQVPGIRRDELPLRLASQTLHDFSMFWSGLPLDANRPATSICHFLLHTHVGGDKQSAEVLGERLAAVFSGRSENPWLTVLAGMTEMLPADRVPTLLLAPADASTANDNDWLRRAANAVAALAIAAPRLPIAIAAPESAVDEYLNQHADSRPAAMLREGRIVVAGVDQATLSANAGESARPTVEIVMERVGTHGIAEELAEALVEAASFSVQLKATEPPEKARSAIERFLFELLESLPETAGLFELNRALAFRHGNASAEADLVADSLRLAIELDGVYYHLQDQEAYRNDRRKDWEYQRHGYLVLRFLSEDVFPRLEEITQTIIEAVAFRKATVAASDRILP